MLRKTFLFLLLSFSTFAGGVRPSQDALALVESYNKFAIESYKKLNLKDNAIYSPYSLAVVLHMASAGAAGETYSEFEKVLGLKEKNLKQVKELLNYLKKRQRAGIISSQAIALQKDYPIHKDYVKTIENNFYSKAFNLDLRKDTEKSIKTLNDWVKKQTKGMIDNAIPEGFISENTSHVLINTAYFNGLWDKPFPLKNTKTRKFKLENGETSKVKFMYNSEMASGIPWPFGQDKEEPDDYRYISLECKHKLLMDCYLPQKDQTISDFEESLNETHFRKRKILWDTNRVFFPKFQFTKSFDCIQALKDLGITKAFDLATADFSKISKTKNYVSFINQKAKITVNERGVKAAAYSGDFEDDFGGSNQLFTFNRPFFFTIVDRPSGLILFMGRVTDPSKR